MDADEKNPPIGGAPVKAGVDWKEMMAVAERIARKIARRCPSWVRAEDLIQAGYRGLVEAYNRHQPEKGEFLPFATLRIRGAVLDELRIGDIAPRRIRSAIKNGLHENDIPTEVALSDAGNEIDYSADPEAVVEKREKSFALNMKLRLLPERLRQICHLLYVEDLTYAEAGRVIGVSESRICQLHDRLLKLIREQIKKPVLAVRFEETPATKKAEVLPPQPEKKEEEKKMATKKSPEEGDAKKRLSEFVGATIMGLIEILRGFTAEQLIELGLDTSQPAAPCSAEDCKKEAEIRGKCEEHYVADLFFDGDTKFARGFIKRKFPTESPAPQPARSPRATPPADAPPEEGETTDYDWAIPLFHQNGGKAFLSNAKERHADLGFNTPAALHGALRRMSLNTEYFASIARGSWQFSPENVPAHWHKK